MSDRCFVYLLTNTANGKLYVGKTKFTVAARWMKHCKSAEKGSPYAIHCAIRKYGETAFTVSLLDVFDTEDVALFAERNWIAKLRSAGDGGYNMCKGGRGVVGWKPTPANIANMKAAAVGRLPSETCFSRSKEVRAQGLSAEAKARMSEAQRARRSCGDDVTDDFRETMRQVAFARQPRGPSSTETRAKQSAGITAAWAKRKENMPTKICSVCSQPVGRGGKGLCKKHYDAARLRT